MGRISTSSRYVIEMTGLDPLYLGDLRGAVHSEKLKKMRYF